MLRGTWSVQLEEHLLRKTRAIRYTLQVIQSPSNCRACGLQCSRCDCIVGDIYEEEMHKRHWRTHLHKRKSIGELLSLGQHGNVVTAVLPGFGRQSITHRNTYDTDR
jgi:hypothetical protein